MNTKLADILKIALSLSFILSGLMKGIDPYGTSLKINEYFNQFGLELMCNVSMILSAGLCSLEICIGLCLLLNVCLLPMLYTALTVLIMFTLLLVVVSIVPEIGVEDCGCFGDVIPIPLSVSVVKNILLIGVVIVILYSINNGSVQYKERKGIISILFVIILSMGIPVCSAVRLPFIEFTEYKIGIDLHDVKSFQIIDEEYSNVTDKVLDTEHQILIIKKKEFSDEELGIVENFKQQASAGLYNVDVVVGVSSVSSKNGLYCSENTLKMMARTPDNAVIYLENGIIKKKKKLGNISHHLKY